MTQNIVVLGGNGYIGQQFIQEWRRRVPDTEFWILSRSGHSNLQLDRVHALVIDLAEGDWQSLKLPAKVDFIVDLVGAPTKNSQQLIRINQRPAEVMLALAKHYQPTAMAFIGGKLGLRSFIKIKQQIIERLRASQTPLALVEPTLVYGGGRHDSMTRLVPFLKIAGVVAPKLRPVTVEMVVNQLLDQLLTIK